jgi:hypothetical protein
MRLLLFHHKRHHFETLLALAENLRNDFQVNVWSDHLHVFGRRKAVETLGLSYFDDLAKYDLVVVVSIEEPLSEARNVGSALQEVLSTTPVVGVCHRYLGHDEPGHIYLFPKAQRSFVTVTTGFAPPAEPAIRCGPHRSILVQGNVEGRRNYDKLPDLAKKFRNTTINVVGIETSYKIAAETNIIAHYNLDEIEFHSTCASNTYIMPMISPRANSGYFIDRFTSSVLIGFSYLIPFIAHESLFDLYPIAGWSYADDAGMEAAVQSALSCSVPEYEDKMRSCEAGRAKLKARNIENFRGLASEMVRSIG